MIRRPLCMGELETLTRMIGNLRHRFALVVFQFVLALFLETACNPNVPRSEITKMPLSFLEFKALGKGIDLPLNATNIMYGQASAGIGGRAMVYRFTAPSEDCLRYAQRLALGS